MTTKAVFVTEEDLLEFLGNEYAQKRRKKTPLEKDSDGELKISMAGKSDVTPTDSINGLNVRNNPTSAAGLLNDLSSTLAHWPETSSQQRV